LVWVYVPVVLEADGENGAFNFGAVVGVVVAVGKEVKQAAGRGVHGH
jgi:hypothetical protein